MYIIISILRLRYSLNNVILIHNLIKLLYGWEPYGLIGPAPLSNWSGTMLVTSVNTKAFYYWPLGFSILGNLQQHGSHTP